jgi:hypothetical protein
MSALVINPDLSRRSYTAVGSFGLAFFKYSYGLNSQTMVEQGTLTPLGSLNGNSDFPPGRVVYENGRKIVPPQGNFPPILINFEGTRPLTSYMVGVFDPQSGISGFIDPNSVNFAINSTDKPVYLNGSEGAGPATNIPNSGNPVVTNGSILSLIRAPVNSLPLPQYVGIAAAGADYLGFMNNNNEGIFVGPYALAISQGLDATDLTGFACGEGGDPNTTNWAGMYGSGNIYYTGNLYTKNTAGVSGNMSGGSVTINNVLMGSGDNAHVFLTYKSFSAGSGGPGVLTYTLTRSAGVDNLYGTLVINSTNGADTSTVNWFMVNSGVGY